MKHSLNWFFHSVESQQLDRELRLRYLFEGIILSLLGIYLLVDTVNGLFVKTLGLPNVVSALFKQALLGLILVFAFQYEQRRFFWCLTCLFAVFIWASLRFFLVDNVWFFLAFQEAIKVIYLFVIVLVLSTFHTFTERKLNLIVLFTISIVFLNILFSLAGFGETTYGSFGAKGFFYSGNALSGVIIICAAFLLVKSFNTSIIKFALVTALLAATALLIGTKGGFLGVLICATLAILFNLNFRALCYGFLIVLTVVALFLVFSEQLQQQPLYQRVLHFYENGGLTRVLFSGRDGKLMRIWPVLVQADFWQLLLGLDLRDMQRYAGIWRAEFDWFDMQINFGLIMSFGVYLGYVILLGKLLVQPKNYLVCSAIVVFIVLVMVSAIAGHVLYNGMVTPLWAIVTAGALNPATLKSLK